MQPALPPGFIDQLNSRLSSTEKVAFLAALSEKPPVSIQLNPRKEYHCVKEDDHPLWHKNACYLPERPSFTLDPTFHSGAYYVQEASSMLISELVRRLMPTNRPWRMLDLCAAPGGKSCLLASIAPPGSVLISNEVIKARYRILQYNLAKWGYDNCWTTNLDPARFSGLANAFDLVLVDAPCSGEGL
ncbi:MAG: RNA methyltransferase, partial [Bacteroidota bacterium]